MPGLDDGWTTPVTWREDAKPVVGVLKTGRLTVRDASDGRERWRVDGLPSHEVGIAGTALATLALLRAVELRFRGTVRLAHPARAQPADDLVGA